MEYINTAKSIPDLVSMMQSRGLSVINQADAAVFLKSVPYFRFAAYLRPMESDKQAHTYKPGSTFESAVALYDFDAALRLLAFSCIQTIEIALRSSMIQVFTEVYGPFWFSDERLARNKFNYVDNISSLAQELGRSKEDFIRDHYLKYGKDSFPPAWKVLELASFGELTKLFFNFADNTVKKQIARLYGIPQHEILESWMRSIGGLRNCCAHHNRIWNRKLSDMPQLPRKLSGKWLTCFDFPPFRLYAALSCMTYWLNAVKPNNTFSQDLNTLLEAHPEVDTAAMGFPPVWKIEPLWSL